MLSTRQNLGSKEKAEEYNKAIGKRIFKCIQEGYHPGCVGDRACESCYHVISDSICLCTPYFICPNCGKENDGRTKGTDKYVFSTGSWKPSDIFL